MSFLQSDLDKSAVKSLDDIRARLKILLGTIQSLISAQIENQGIWLPPGTVQSSIIRISTEFKELTQLLVRHQDLLASTVVTPSLTFPFVQQGMLDQLLRSKLDPQAADWIENGHALAEEQASKQILGAKDMTQLWRSAQRIVAREGASQIWNADYTLAEKKIGIENVVTGLNRELREPDTPPSMDDYNGPGDGIEEFDSDEEEEAEGQDGDRMETDLKSGPTSKTVSEPVSAQPGVPMDSMLRFMTRGTMI